MSRSYKLSPGIDISFVSNERPSIDRMFLTRHDGMDSGAAPRLSTDSDNDIESLTSYFSGAKSMEMSGPMVESEIHSYESEKSSWLSSQNMVRTKVQ